MIVKVAPLGEKVVEINVDEGSTVIQCLDIAEVDVNGRTIRLNNQEAKESTVVSRLDNGNVPTIVLSTAMKGGC